MCEFVHNSVDIVQKHDGGAQCNHFDGIFALQTITLMVIWNKEDITMSRNTLNKAPKTEYVIPQAIGGDDIKQVRRSLNMTQRELADFLRVSVPTVERWESGLTEITGPVIALMDILKRDNRYVEYLELPARTTPLRLVYYYKNMVCTVIDVNEVMRRVSIRNYTDNLMFRAFGRIDHPTYEDYEEFIESRCIPRERDKMKLHLQELGIPFYDPMLIIEKTHGRMAEDDFRLEIER